MQIPTPHIVALGNELIGVLHQGNQSLTVECVARDVLHHLGAYDAVRVARAICDIAPEYSHERRASNA